ncbi:MAG: hypothetical protein FWC64_04930 [Treponema sp.]|nr:hypothetical protein [Treponema sp.]
MRNYIKKTALLFVLAAPLIFALHFTGCDSFFTSSFASARDYDARHINVTVNNLDRWLDRTVGNLELARQVNVAIINRLSDSSLSPQDRAKFQRAGVQIAVESSNLGVILLSNALGAITDMADGLSGDQLEERLREILGGIQGEFNASGGSDAAKSISAIVSGDIVNDNGVPTFPPGSFAHDTSPSEAAKAIIVLALAEMGAGGIDAESFNDFDELAAIGLSLNESGDRIAVDAGASDTAHVLAAYINLIASDTSGNFEDNFLTNAIRDAFFGTT